MEKITADVGMEQLGSGLCINENGYLENGIKRVHEDSVGKGRSIIGHSAIDQNEVV